MHTVELSAYGAEGARVEITVSTEERSDGDFLRQLAELCARHGVTEFGSCGCCDGTSAERGEEHIADSISVTAKR